MHTLIIKKLDTPELLKTANRLAAVGSLQLANNYLYLKISDAYIHELYPFVQSKKIIMPHYFDKYTMGAHITVIYPEENTSVNEQEVNKQHHFEVKEAFSTVIGIKTYYALRVQAPTLLQLRRNYALPDLLMFKNHYIDFHITFAIKEN